MKSTLAALAVALSSVSVAASAASYDFADFGNSVFSYGYGTNGASFTAFPNASPNCFGTSFSCQTAGGPNDVPSVGVNTGSSPISFAGTVTLPTGTLFLHPGSGAGLDAIARFTAPTTSVYQIDAAVLRLDNTSNGNGVTGSVFVNGAPIGVLPLSNLAGSVLNDSFNVTLTAGDILSFGINNNGDYTYDSTGLQGTINAVPEPAAWALMIGGFGLVGGALRVRSRKVRFA